ncbi:MAG: hypothetical protein AAFY71_12750 [Bacteroidota bacterium]
MPAYHLIEVKTRQQKKAFWRLSSLIYQHDPNWIPHRRKDEIAVFDPQKNEHAKEAQYVRFLLHDGQKYVGRIAAFILRGDQDKLGRIGFFESIREQEVAFKLFAAAEHWLRQKGISSIEGPVNLGEKERFWGLMASNSISNPYLHNYHPAYYQAFFEEWGFQTHYQQFYYVYRIEDGLPAAYQKMYSRLMEQQKYSLKMLDMRLHDQFLRDFVQVYNDAWTSHDSFQPISYDKAGKIFSLLRPIMEESGMWFAYEKSEVIGIFFMIPDINQLWQKIPTKLPTLLRNLWFYILLRLKKWNRRQVFGLGVRSAWQRKGVEALLLQAAQLDAEQEGRIKEILIAWIGDFNPKMVNLAGKFCGPPVRTSITYRKDI